MVGRLEILLLGTPEVRLDGDVVTGFRSSKAQALLYYLATTGQSHTRLALAGLLWTEWDDSQARVNLNKTLSNLRQVVGDHLDITRQAVAFNPDSNHWIDVEEFAEGAIASAAPETLAAVTELYRGDFLEGFYVNDAPAFEEWMLRERAQWREQALHALHTLTNHHLTQGAAPQALETLRRILTLEPWREEAHRQIMLLLAQSGQRSAALAQYETCRQVLADELSVEPTQETTELYYRIRAGQIQPAAAPAVVVEASRAELPSTPRFNLPPQATPFVGRAADLQTIRQRLEDPACRLLTLVGPGGIGKTRIALQVAHHMIEDHAEHGRYAHGVVFVPLNSVSSAAGMISAIADAMGFHLYNNVPPKQQLLDYLREKKLLLVLDNFEHLSDGADLAAEILSTAPHVVLLITSRTALNLQEEWFHPVAGMAFPSSTAPRGRIDNYDAVHFFIQCARRAAVEFDPVVEQPHILRICRLVEGMPLALELAAAWLKALPCAQIALEIERSLDILTTRYRDIPARHRSLRAVLEQSWQMLTPGEQDVLRRLSVFRAGFHQAAADTVAAASLLALAMLVEKSLIYVTESGRYQIHELLRQFAAEKLAEDAEEAADARARHSAYYLDLLQAHAQKMVGGAQPASLAVIGEEIENVRAAWQWALEHQNVDALDRTLEGMYTFYQIRSRYHEGAELFDQVVARLPSLATANHPRLDSVRARCHSRLGAFHQYLGDYEAAERCLQAGLETAEALDDRGEVAFALNWLGQVAVWRGQKEAAREHLRRSLAICREIGDKSGVISALQQLANLFYATFGDYIESKELAEESLFFSQEVGRSDWMAYALDTLGFVTFALGEYDAALAYYQEGLARFEEIGDQHGVVLTLGGIGMVNWALGGDKLWEAIHAFELSLNLCREIGHQGQVSGRLGGLARVLNDLGEYERALQHGTEGLAIARSLGSPVYLSHNLYCLAETACGMNDLQSARRYLREGLQVAFEAQILSTITIYLYYYALILAKESKLSSIDGATRRRKEKNALRALVLVQHHPACWQIFKDRAAWLREWVASDLPADVVAAAEAQGKAIALDELVTALIQDLTSTP